MVRGAIVGAVLLLAGCYDSYQYQPYYPNQHRQPASGQPPAGQHEALLGQAPPEPYAEELTDPPEDGMVWCDGYWTWSASSYVWVGGRWLWPPGPGLYWYPGGYVRRPGGYVRMPGRWGAPGWRQPYAFIHRSSYAYRAPLFRGGYYRGGAYRGGGYRGGYFRGGHGRGHGRR